MKKITVLIVLLALSSIVLSACAESSLPERVPLELLNFNIEENPKYIGSYIIERSNFTNGERWSEFGEWTEVQALFGREIVCFGYFDYDNGYGTFSSRSDYHWKEILFDNSYCLELLKRK